MLSFLSNSHQSGHSGPLIPFSSCGIFSWIPHFPCTAFFPSPFSLPLRSPTPHHTTLEHVCVKVCNFFYPKCLILLGAKSNSNSRILVWGHSYNFICGVHTAFFKCIFFIFLIFKCFWEKIMIFRRLYHFGFSSKYDLYLFEYEST